MKSKLILLGLMMILLNACTWNTPDASTREMVYPINNPYESQAWTEEPKEAAPLPKFVKTAEVPQVQMSAKNLDLEWVRQQNPKDYTIMLAANPQPLLISQALMEAPQNQHRAALKFDKNGKTYYTGVYGNYIDQEKAQESLANLPAEVRQQAQIVEWQQVQRLNNL